MQGVHYQTWEYHSPLDLKDLPILDVKSQKSFFFELLFSHLTERSYDSEYNENMTD